MNVYITWILNNVPGNEREDDTSNDEKYNSDDDEIYMGVSSDSDDSNASDDEGI